MEATGLNIHIENAQQADALKYFLQAFNIKFDVLGKVERPYNEDFVNKIQESRRQAQNGEVIEISLDEIWNG